MAGSSNTTIFSIKVTGDIRHGWYGQEYQYKDLGSDLGVTTTQPGNKPPDGTVIGGNIKPPRVRIRTDKGSSFTRFIASDKIEDMVHKNGLVGKAMKDKKGTSHKICNVSIKSN